MIVIMIFFMFLIPDMKVFMYLLESMQSLCLSSSLPSKSTYSLEVLLSTKAEQLKIMHDLSSSGSIMSQSITYIVLCRN